MEAIVFYLLKSAGILAIFFFSYQFFLKKETFFKINRHYLLAGILGSLLLPLVIFTNYVYIEPVTQTIDPAWLMADIPVTYNVVEEANPFNWFLFGTYLYIIGIMVFALRFIIQLISLFKLFRTHTIKKEDGFNFVEVNTNISPFSFFNFIVYNPRNYGKGDLEIIINHEKAHGNQFHSVDILLSQLFLILQWCNPLAWYYKKSIQQNLEYMADQFVIAKVESKQYQHTLLKASLKPQFASITNNFYNSLIKKRIIMLNQSKSNIINAWKYFVILPALALFLMSFNVETVEVLKEQEKSDMTTTSDFLFTGEDNFITNKDEAESASQAKISTDKFVISQQGVLQKKIEIEINKNTTESQLKEIAEALKKDGVEFSFKNVKRNAQNEITGINVTYKDSNGNTGNYALSSDNPINTFYFFKKENGSIGFYSKLRLKDIEERKLSKVEREDMMKERKKFMEEHKDELMKEREHIMQERMKMMEEHKAMSKERRKEIEIHMKEARKEHEKARKEYDEQRKIIIKERIKRHDSLKDKHSNIFIYDSDEHDENVKLFTGKSGPLFIIDGEESDGDEIAVRMLSPHNIKKMNVIKGDKAKMVYGNKGENGVIIITTKPHGENDFDFEFEHEMDEPNIEIIGEPHMELEWVSKNHNMNMIKKNSTDAELKRLKTELKNQDIDFKYSKLKRNKDGKITRIKVSMNDNNGNKSSSTFDSGEKGINPILIGKNNNKLTIKSI